MHEIYRIQLTSPDETKELLSAEEYEEYIEEQAGS
jgi:hypothetical protein